METMRDYAAKMLHALRSPAIGIIWKSSKGERSKVLLLSVFNALSALLSLCLTLVLRNLIDAAVGKNLPVLRDQAILLAVMLLVMLLNGYLKNMLQARTSINLLKRMRNEAITRIFRKKYAALQPYHSGELVNRVFSDVSVIADGIISIVPPFLFLSIQLVGAAIILYRLSSRFMWILLLAGAVGATISLAMRRKMKDMHRKTLQAEDKYHARIQETLGNLRIIKSSELENRMIGEVGFVYRAFADAQIKRARFASLMGTGLGFIFRASWFLALIWGCIGISRGRMTFGTLTAILQLVGQIQAPFEGLISTVVSIYGAVSSAERLMELYDLPDEKPQPMIDNLHDRFRGIRLNDVVFFYDNRGEVLKGVNLSIRKGDSIAIMGLTGCGKSTLFLLMLGVYEPKGGCIQVDLTDRQLNSTVRSLFSYVPQGNALFSGTLKENIAMFCKHTPSDAEIWHAAELACIDTFIRSLEQGMETLIGEHGLGLSEGQAQRVAIARALLNDAPILLLDEATSALDEQTEARLLRNISALNDRTCLIVTHRRAALEVCNRRFSMEDGILTEKNTNECE